MDFLLWVPIFLSQGRGLVFDPQGGCIPLAHVCRGPFFKSPECAGVCQRDNGLFSSSQTSDPPISTLTRTRKPSSGCSSSGSARGRENRVQFSLNKFGISKRECLVSPLFLFLYTHNRFPGVSRRPRPEAPLLLRLAPDRPTGHGGVRTNRRGEVGWWGLLHY